METFYIYTRVVSTRIKVVARTRTQIAKFQLKIHPLRFILKSKFRKTGRYLAFDFVDLETIRTISVIAAIDIVNPGVKTTIKVSLHAHTHTHTHTHTQGDRPAILTRPFVPPVPQTIARSNFASGGVFLATLAYRNGLERGPRNFHHRNHCRWRQSRFYEAEIPAEKTEYASCERSEGDTLRDCNVSETKSFLRSLLSGRVLAHFCQTEHGKLRTMLTTRGNIQNIECAFGNILRVKQFLDLSYLTVGLMDRILWSIIVLSTGNVRKCLLMLQMLQNIVFLSPVLNIATLHLRLATFAERQQASRVI